MSIREIKDLKQHCLDEMQSITNQISIENYRNEKIDVHYRRDCEIRIDDLKEKLNEMSIEIRKKEKEKLEQLANLSTYPSRHFNSFCYDDDDDEEYTIAITILERPRLEPQTSPLHTNASHTTLFFPSSGEALGSFSV
ncbi:hypothetical protein Tco_0023129 [Tanacetum coccineum]